MSFSAPNLFRDISVATIANYKILRNISRVKGRIKPTIIPHVFLVTAVSVQSYVHIIVYLNRVCE